MEKVCCDHLTTVTERGGSKFDPQVNKISRKMEMFPSLFCPEKDRLRVKTKLSKGCSFNSRYDLA